MALLLACCGRSEVKPAQPPAVVSVRDELAVPSASAAPNGARSVAVEAATAPGLFVRAADVLMPLACAQPGAWGRGEACVARAKGEPMRLYPPLAGESATVQASPTIVDFPVSNTREAGLLMPGSKGETIESRPFLGFGAVGTRKRVRFTRAGAQRLEEGLREWCRGKSCAGPLPQALDVLEERAALPETIRLAERQLAPALSAKLGKGLPAQSGSTIYVRASGRNQQVIALAVDLHHEPEHGEGLLPYDANFLVARDGDVFRHLIMDGAYTEGLGETGQVLAAIDLDDDGTDELILEWRYSGGRWYRLVRRSGDRLKLLGDFGDGC
jgi:hypothetical protein